MSGCSVYSNPGTLKGFRVLINPMCDDVPRMTTSQQFANLMPPAFVADLNAWMLEFFGTQSFTYQLSQDTLVMGPKAYRALQEQL